MEALTNIIGHSCFLALVYGLKSLTISSFSDLNACRKWLRSRDIIGLLGHARTYYLKPRNVSLSASAIPYTTGSVTSAGTTIGYRQVGSGPGLLLLHGGMQASQHYMRLAAALANSFTVYLPDRRGRGLSGSPGEQHSLAQECEDVAVLLDKTDAHLEWRIKNKHL